MRILGLLLLAFSATGRADAICTGGAPGTVLLRGTVLDCRSAAPELEAALEPHREAHERWREGYRSLPNFDSLYILRPYSEKVASRLERVNGVIVTFAVDGHARIPGEPVWQDLDRPERRELFLRVGASCDRLPEPLPTVLAVDSVCCDVMPSSDDSCMLGMKPASLPEPSLLGQIR